MGELGNTSMTEVLSLVAQEVKCRLVGFGAQEWVQTAICMSGLEMKFPSTVLP